MAYEDLKQDLMIRTATLFFIFLLVTLVSINVLFNVKSVAIKRNWWGVFLTLSALVSVIYLGMDRNTFLPFLSEGVVPPSVLKIGTPADATMAVTIDENVPRGATHCMYWASKNATDTIGDPWTAYDKFQNAGVVPIENGLAILKLSCPGTYKVPRKRDPLPKHVHYRWVYPSGIVSEVKTQNVRC